MRRVTIVGAVGAGKSTFGLDLSRAVGLDVVHLDIVFQACDHNKPIRKAREAALAKVLQRPSFILEGAHRWTFAPRLAQCDTVIWLDIAPLRRLINMLRRKVSRRVPIGQHDDPAKARLQVSRLPSPVQLFRDQLQDAALLEPVFAKPPDGVRMIRLRTHVEARNFLDGLNK